MTTFTWGILGAARIARALIPAIRVAGGEVAVLGVRDPHSERARAFAEEWGIPHMGTYDDVMASDVQAVYNPLPNDAHRPWTQAALRAGKHALTEKPLCLNAGEAQLLADTAARSGRVLLEAFAYRFQPHVTRLREIVAGGELGEVLAYRGAFGFGLMRPDDFRWEAEKGGGALYDVGCYLVNLARLLLGEPESVTAQARWTAGGVDLGLSGTLNFGQALASLDCAFDWGNPPTQRLMVVGTAGTLEMTGVFRSRTETELSFRVQTAAGERTETFAPHDGYAAMVTHFQRAARGEEAALYPPEDAVCQARVLDALFTAAREGRQVLVER
ncbi:Gfo/Idh/MocA family oxidoreductase [Deinococcus metallilatus]|uniref:Dehydrogenase n=1 Tax=Deinococcus metallilatus TaxID=1211322 RepID=A0AAJ5F3H5_9DEIO|nr:Gfo/Idh/MocA family oxidoreductase [Deinococcus metallilatus]MBB5296004.1 putative dehydrogenase [Deinococcus metallilatus]QBY08176.1 Gfo/Idh/MocA family oxidoreductase [Deinococcus metallilatus]RXJ11908.1 Gfo/Idh/MocA family oxidoreductase [Deinococcus metallilatus]TLK25860.1 Gfo/Idh/MocA family oxidoreductase [Deinococcus metallilatus]GMA14461.1 oxidoreductase [Deinococcus metallilatus]